MAGATCLMGPALSVPVGVDASSTGGPRTPPPAWAQDGKWATRTERELLDEIVSVTTSISAMQERRTKLDQQLEDAGTLRGLLYEQGPQLERAVREALTLFGFSAKPFKGGDSEFDVIFDSVEGRFLRGSRRQRLASDQH